MCVLAYFLSHARVRPRGANALGHTPFHTVCEADACSDVMVSAEAATLAARRRLLCELVDWGEESSGAGRNRTRAC